MSPTHIDNLHAYYQFQAPRNGGKGWSGGPHLFVDAEGIWVFNPLDLVGVHSPSFNANSWGVEMLGDFGSESFSDGLGLQIHANAVRAVAALLRRLGATDATALLHLHKEDHATNHDCPGKNVNKAAFIAELNKQLAGAEELDSDGISTKIIVFRKGVGPENPPTVKGIIRGGSTFADRVKLAAATGLAPRGKGEVMVRSFVGSKFTVSFDVATQNVFLGEK